MFALRATTANGNVVDHLHQDCQQLPDINYCLYDRKTYYIALGVPHSGSVWQRQEEAMTREKHILLHTVQSLCHTLSAICITRCLVLMWLCGNAHI